MPSFEPRHKEDVRKIGKRGLLKGSKPRRAGAKGETRRKYDYLIKRWEKKRKKGKGEERHIPARRGEKGRKRKLLQINVGLTIVERALIPDATAPGEKGRLRMAEGKRTITNRMSKGERKGAKVRLATGR